MQPYYRRMTTEFTRPQPQVGCNPCMHFGWWWTHCDKLWVLTSVACHLFSSSERSQVQSDI